MDDAGNPLGAVRILWSDRVMRPPPRAAFVIVPSVLLALGGCTRSHPSAGWRPSYTLPMGDSAGSSSALVYSPGLSGRANAMYLIRPGDAAYGRNDDTLSLRDRSRRDELLGIPEERRATLDRERTFRGTRRAEDYVYPSTDGSGLRGSGRYRPYRRSP